MPRIRKLIRLMFALGLAAATFEIAARIDDWVRFGANPVGYYGSKVLRWVDDEGLPYNRPGVRFEKWRHDAHGYREHPVSVAADSVAGDIVCLGTSESYGLHESPGREWPAVFASLVAGDGLRVANASVVGMSPFQYGAFLNRYILAQHPGMVVLVVSPFNFVAGMTGGARPDPSAPVDPAQIARMRNACKPTPKELSRFLPKARVSFMKRLPDRWADAISSRRQRRKSVQQGPGTMRSTALLDAPPRDQLIAYTSLLDELARHLSASGVEVVFSTYPNSLRDDGSASAADGMAGRRRWLPGYSPAGLMAISREFAAATLAHCDSMGYRCVDLEADLPKDDATFADSVHLTDVGADLVARSVYRELFAESRTTSAVR